MLGGGTSRNYCFPNTSGNGAIGSCRMRGNRDNFITDVDDNVIIVEDHDALQQELGGSSVVGEDKRSLSVINIDDDDESHFTDFSDLSAEDDGAIDSDDTQRTIPVSNCMPRSEDAGADDCGVIGEKRPAFKLSKCKNMYASKSPPRNRYGLNSQSENDSESDSSDCEVIEGSSSELREQWNKARLKRKSNSYDKGLGLQDHVSPCSSQSDSQPGIKVGNGTKQYPEDPVCSRGKNLHFQEASSSYFPATDDGFISNSFNPWTDGVFTEAENFSQRSKPKSWKNSASHLKNDVSFSEQICTENCGFGCIECHGINRFQNERFDSCGHSPRSIHRSNKKVIGTRNCFPHSNQRVVGEHSFGSTVVKPNLDSKRPCVQDHDVEASLREDQFLGGTHSSIPTNIFSMDKDLKFSKTNSSRNMCSEETQCEILGSEVKDKLCPTTPSDIEGHDPLNKLISNSHEGKNSLVVSCGDVISTVPNDIINERERLKETDEYKRAAEEEWEARQQQLKIQAEEVKKLKKRRKAETLRILDMEKRQKQRVEEVRETQRKDEENLNMKEHLRAEIRKQLYRLEITCTDMASLLRGLGIHVEGGFHPLSRGVNAAYKRALLKFHPDRASRTDIRQQVESEEKFKLISRMKEKFLPP